MNRTAAGLSIPMRPVSMPKSAIDGAIRLLGFDYGEDLIHILAFDFGNDGGAIGIWREGDNFCARISLDALAAFWHAAKKQGETPTVGDQAQAEEKEKDYHAALQRVGTALGLPAGSDLTKACVPAIEALRAAHSTWQPTSDADLPGFNPMASQ